jgi:hypothetical protein
MHTHTALPVITQKPRNERKNAFENKEGTISPYKIGEGSIDYPEMTYKGLSPLSKSENNVRARCHDLPIPLTDEEMTRRVLEIMKRLEETDKTVRQRVSRDNAPAKSKRRAKESIKLRFKRRPNSETNRNKRQMKWNTY